MRSISDRRAGACGQAIREELFGLTRCQDIGQSSGKSMQRTISAGDRSQTSCQSGLPSVFAQRSQIALTTAAVARWTIPFSGPSQRS